MTIMMRTGRRNNNCTARYYNDAFDLMDDMFTNFWGTGLESTSNMRTDVIEEEGDYQLITDLLSALPGYIEVTTGLKREDQSAEPLVDVVSGFLLTQWYYGDHADDQALTRTIDAILKAITIKSRSAD